MTERQVKLIGIYCLRHPDVLAVRYLRSTKRNYCQRCWDRRVETI